MAVRTGVGLRRVMLLEPLAEESAELVAWTVIEFGSGREAGAVNMPEEEIVPVEELPPATLLTDQATAVLVVPETEAVNCWELPALMVAGFGKTETWICAGGWGAVPEPELRTAAHPEEKSKSAQVSVRVRCFKKFSSRRLPDRTRWWLAMRLGLSVVCLL